MGGAQNNIALIYFSRQAYEEGRKKLWFPNKSAEKNKAVASSLIHQTSHLVRNSGYPVFHYHEGNQQGATFGERLANAYQEVFQLGYDAVIAVGNDSPEIANIDWEEVNQQLLQGNCVIGPSLRGGAYLIGITAAAFCKQDFQHLPWQTNKLYNALTAIFSNTGHAPYVLKKLRDINSYYDLHKLIKTACLNYSFKNLIRRLFSQNKRFPNYHFHTFPQSPLILSSSPRGPPQFLL